MSQTPPLASFTPPMQPGPLGPGPAPSWPKVIGIIATVFGCYGILASIWGFVSPFVMRGIIASAGQSGAVATLDRWRWWTFASSAITFALALLLISGGTGLMSLRPRGPFHLKIWSVLRIGFAFITCALTWQIMQDQFAAMASKGSSAPPPGMTGPMLMFGVVLGLLWGCAFPVFLLVYLPRAGSMWAQGRCPRCGYDLAGLRGGPCPECGTATA